MYNEDVMNVIYEAIGISNNEDEALNEFTIGSIKKIKELAQRLRNKHEDLKEIKNKLDPNKSSDKEIKKYIDKSMDIIQKSTEEIGSNRKEFKEAIIKKLIRHCIELVAAVGMAFVTISSIPGLIVILILSICIIVDSINGMIKQQKYVNANVNVQNDLGRLKSILTKLQNKKELKDSDKAKITKCIDKIDDARGVNKNSVTESFEEVSWEDLYEQYVVDESFNDIEESYDPWAGLE